MEDIVRVWEEDVIIPTYATGKPEKNPLFLEKRVYQGSSGSVYPYPVIEKISDHKEDKYYHACFLENIYLKIMILPELGGRVQMAFDKIRNRHFVYYNQVIKPALVGLTGPWISGGIEFNWPQHHRPSTFMPLDFCIEEFADGSKTIWCSEVERMFRTKGMTGFTLYPGKAFLEIKVSLYNRTIFPQTFLWWANPAVKVNDFYQSVFPPDVNAVFDHGKRDVSRFPIATGTYYKVDYSTGVDISRYKNIPVPTSYMAIQSKYDFVGGYEHDTKCGILHVADHHISPGKKQWTWGCGDFGKAWDRNLTDEDGPYIELMTGVFTDNQPDFSWLMAYEERSFKQYFMPYSEAGIVKNATKDALLNLEIETDYLLVRLYTTAEYRNARVFISFQGKNLLDRSINISPGSPFTEKIKLSGCPNPSGIEASLTDEKGNLLIAWTYEDSEGSIIPEPAKPAREPAEIISMEQLYLTGLHIEQYRHATYNPMNYYMEALTRDPGDIRCNNAVGLWYMRHGKFTVAESYFRNAIRTLTERNSNPDQGVSFFNLGWSLKLQGRQNEAYDAFYKSVWNAEWQDAGYFSLALIATSQGRFNEALDFTCKSLSRNQNNHKCRHLRSALLRIGKENDCALEFINQSLAIDKFNFGCLYEKYRLLKETSVREAGNALSCLKARIKGSVNTYIEYSLDYYAAGLYDEAADFLFIYLNEAVEVYPIVYYLFGYLDFLRGNKDSALINYRKASELRPDYCFPSRVEEVIILQNAIELNKGDAKAAYYLGNYWYANQQYDNALELWEKSAGLNNSFPTVLRNLALVYFNKKNEYDKALELLGRAFELDKTDARIFMELDQLFKRTGVRKDERLAFMEKHLDLVYKRDDLYLERITLYNQAGQYQKAKELIECRIFHPWEGGEGKVPAQFIFSHLGLTRIALTNNDFNLALNLLKSLEHYPENLGEGKLYGTPENHINYFTGCAYEGSGDKQKASLCFEKAAKGNMEPSEAFFYNDYPSDMIYYQGLALLKLGNVKAANIRFDRLVDYGEKQMSKPVKIDYFAVSLPDLLIWDDDLVKRNQVNCHYLMGLGLLGRGELKRAMKYFKSVLSLDRNHSGTLFQVESLSH